MLNILTSRTNMRMYALFKEILLQNEVKENIHH